MLRSQLAVAEKARDEHNSQLKELQGKHAGIITERNDLKNAVDQRDLSVMQMAEEVERLKKSAGTAATKPKDPVAEVASIVDLNKHDLYAATGTIHAADVAKFKLAIRDLLVSARDTDASQILAGMKLAVDATRAFTTDTGDTTDAQLTKLMSASKNLAMQVSTSKSAAASTTEVDDAARALVQNVYELIMKHKIATMAATKSPQQLADTQITTPLSQISVKATAVMSLPQLKEDMKLRTDVIAQHISQLLHVMRQPHYVPEYTQIIKNVVGNVDEVVQSNRATYGQYTSKQ